MHGEPIIPFQGNNLDVSNLHLGSKQSRFTRNFDISLIGSLKDGENELVFKPLQQVDLFDPNFRLPDGDNYTVGAKVSHGTSEVYTMVFNTNGQHSIYRTNGNRLEYVFQGPELECIVRPENFVSGESRWHVEKVCVGNSTRTYIMWTNGATRQGFLCVEDSIGTNFFNSFSYPIFQKVKDRRDLIALGIRSPVDCIQIKPVQSGKKRQNRLKKKTWQFRLKYIDVYGRPSEHGVISDIFYQSDCIQGSDCLELTFDAGGPMVEKIQVEYRIGCSTEWSIHEILNKLEPCAGSWYEKPINTKLTYDNATNKITYTFCADKECKTAPDVETERNMNPMPITSEALIPLAGSIALAGNRYGHEPFSCDVMDKISFEVEKPAPSPTTAIATRNITVWVQIYNPYNSEGQPIYKWANQTVFGGLGPDSRNEDGLIAEYGQYFADADQEGFIGYLAGTNIATISRQYLSSNNGNVFGPWAYHGVEPDRHTARTQLGRWIQKFEFKNVPPGRYVFRIAGQGSRITDKDYQRTSTYVPGRANILSNGVIEGGVRDEVKEIYVDVCDKD
jgi:hypothetical protein